jgi:hypothetical protein
MPGMFDPAAFMSAMQHRAQLEAAEEMALAQTFENNRKFAELIERARGWVEPKEGPRVPHLTPATWSRASLGLAKQVYSGNSQPLLMWNGANFGENLAFTIDFTVQSTNGTAGQYPDKSGPPPPIHPGPPTPAPYDYSPYCILSSGAGDIGGDLFEVDVDTGGRVTLAGSFLTVKVAMDAPLTGYNAGTMNIAAYIGLFAAPSVAPVKRTRRTDTVADGTNSSDLIIPPRSKQIMPILCSDKSATGEVHIQNANGNDLAAWLFSSGTTIASVPLPLGAYKVVIKNTSGFPASFQVPFQIGV